MLCNDLVALTETLTAVNQMIMLFLLAFGILLLSVGRLFFVGLLLIVHYYSKLVPTLFYRL